MMRLKGLFLALVVLGLAAGWAHAGDADEEVERILKKFDEKLRKLREEMRQELMKALGKKTHPPAKEGVPYLGIDVEPVKEGLRVLLNLDKGEGLVVRRVIDGSPADRAGIRKWDILLSLAGGKMGTKGALREVVGDLRPGKEVKVLLLRDGEKVDLRLVIGTRGEKHATPRVGEFLDETLRNRKAQVRKHLRGLISRNAEERMRARRYFEKILSGPGKRHEKVYKEIEKAAEEMLGKLSPKDREELLRVFRKMMRGYKHTVKKGKGSQKKEDIERFLEEMLGGKKPKVKEPAGEDDIDRLLDDLLGKKKPKDGRKKDDGEKGDDDLPITIPPKWDKAMADILGSEAWNRIKNMMKDPQWKPMLEQFFPEGFEFTPANVRKLLEQQGIDMETLPDRLREMGVEEEAIENILKLLKETEKPAKKVKGWVGIKARNVEEDGGVEVAGVESGGPATKAGLKEGDVIVKAGRFKVKNKGDLKKALKGRFAGDTITFTVKRDGETLKIRLKLGVKK